MLTTLFPPGVFTFAFHLVAYSAAFALILRVIATVFGPTVKQYSPKAYAFLARTGAFVLALLLDVVGAWKMLTDEGAVPPAPSDARKPIDPPPAA